MKKFSKKLLPIADPILSWYARNKREFPWRRTRNPYFIWVSEVMLQQTQVDTVIPYYHRFLSQFPTLETLAKASLQEVLKAWENMGYYARARHLHAAAREILKHMDGKIPGTRDELIRLPGIGSYTASAILSFAFGKTFPTVDSNAGRVVCRLFCIKEPIDQRGTQKRIYELAAEMISKKDPAGFNHAIMELGATICTPRRPSCTCCPVQESCLAFQKGLQEALPSKRKGRPLPHKQATAAIIADGRGQLLIVERPNRGLLGGLWKFPGGLCKPEETPKEGLRRAVHEELGIRIRVQDPVTTVEHAFTHFRMTLHGFRSDWRDGNLRALGCKRYQWVRPSNLADFPFSKADRMVSEGVGHIEL